MIKYLHNRHHHPSMPIFGWLSESNTLSFAIHLRCVARLYNLPSALHHQTLLRSCCCTVRSGVFHQSKCLFYVENSNIFYGIFRLNKIYISMDRADNKHYGGNADGRYREIDIEWESLSHLVIRGISQRGNSIKVYFRNECTVMNSFE